MKSLRIDKRVLTTILLSKITVFIIIFLAYNFFPFNKTFHDVNFLNEKNEKISLQSAFSTWDTQHYLFLSEKGYIRGNVSNAFFPLFPISISILNNFLSNSFLSGIIVTNIFSAAGLIYFYLFCREYFKDKKLAFRSFILLLSFPTAFFFSLIYSESLFLFLASALFYYLYTKKYFLASIFALFIPISRPVGILISLPYLTYWVYLNVSIASQSFKKILSQIVEKLLLNKRTYLILSPFLGFAAYFLFMQVSTGSYLEILNVIKYYRAEWNVSNIFNPILFFVNLFFPDSPALHGFTNSIIDRVFFIFYLLLLYLIYKRLDKTMFVYALFFGMTPLLGSFMSYARYLLVVFPIFMIMAKIFSLNKYTLLFYPTVLLFVIQIIFLIMHSLNYWVA